MSILTIKFVCNYLFSKDFAYVTKYKYIKCKGDEQGEKRYYRNWIAVLPFLKYFTSNRLILT